MSQLHVQVISQEESLLDDEVDLVTIPSADGELTILPHHAALITQLKAGVVTIRKQNKNAVIAIGGGFATVEPNNSLTILADTAIKAEDISLKQAEAAKRRAEEKMRQQTGVSDREFKFAEAQLRRALIELQVARKHKTHIATPTEP